MLVNLANHHNFTKTLTQQFLLWIKILTWALTWKTSASLDIKNVNAEMLQTHIKGFGYVLQGIARSVYIHISVYTLTLAFAYTHAHTRMHTHTRTQTHTHRLLPHWGCPLLSSSELFIFSVPVYCQSSSAPEPSVTQCHCTVPSYLSFCNVLLVMCVLSYFHQK